MSSERAPRASSDVAAAARGSYMLDDNDAEDYYDFLPSESDSSDDADDTEVVNTSATTAPLAAAAASDGSSERSGLQDGIVTTTSVLLGAPASRSVASVSASAVLTPVGVLGAASRDSSRTRDARPPQDVLARITASSMMLAGGNELRVSPTALAQHASRKAQLESALDALSLASVSSTGGEAPFRFRASELTTSAASEDVEMAVAAETAPHSSGHRHTSGSTSANATASTQDTSSDADPLYDDSMDDADEAWVQRNFRVQGAEATDATLCCPCCFLPVCLDCQRHVTYTTQYRASVAVNCRIKRDEILTYARDAASASALPFARRLDLAAARSSSDRASLLTPDEFYPVACSDCGTTVGVLDRAQQYHFFNVLPSTC